MRNDLELSKPYSIGLYITSTDNKILILDNDPWLRRSEISDKGGPGVAIISPSILNRREMISFKDVVYEQHGFLLTGVSRGIYDTSASAHKTGENIYFDQNERYKPFTENQERNIVKRFLRELIE